MTAHCTRVAVILEQRFERTPDGVVWTTGPFPYSFWARYLAEYSRVRVIARVLDVDGSTVSKKRADGPAVDFAAFPYYLGVRQFVRARGRVYKAVADAIAPTDAV